MPVDPNVLIALISGLFAVAGIFVAQRVGVSSTARVDARLLEAKCRSLEDYTNLLRGVLETSKLPVPPYPAELREVKL